MPLYAPVSAAGVIIPFTKSEAFNPAYKVKFESPTPIALLPPLKKNPVNGFAFGLTSAIVLFGSFVLLINKKVYLIL